MANLARKKGSRKERELVDCLAGRGLKAWRLASAGTLDGEDVMVDTPRFGGVRVQVKYRRSVKHWRVAQWAQEVAARRDGEWWILVVPVPNRRMTEAVVVMPEDAAREWGLAVDSAVSTPKGLCELDGCRRYRGWVVCKLGVWLDRVG